MGGGERPQLAATRAGRRGTTVSGRLLVCTRGWRAGVCCRVELFCCLFQHVHRVVSTSLLKCLDSGVAFSLTICSAMMCCCWSSQRREARRLPACCAVLAGHWEAAALFTVLLMHVSCVSDLGLPGSLQLWTARTSLAADLPKGLACRKWSAPAGLQLCKLSKHELQCGFNQCSLDTQVFKFLQEVCNETGLFSFHLARKQHGEKKSLGLCSGWCEWMGTEGLREHCCKSASAACGQPHLPPHLPLQAEGGLSCSTWADSREVAAALTEAVQVWGVGRWCSSLLTSPHSQLHCLLSKLLMLLSSPGCCKWSVRVYFR